jgi:uncharacterized membrane protein YraQ (UPF0718 family)
VPSKTTLIFIIIAIAVAGLGYWSGGTPLLAWSTRDAALLTFEIIPQLVLGLLIGAFVSVLLPRKLLLHWIGDESNFRGVVVASIAGALMPGGPFASFPIIFALHRAGANIGAVVAFLVAWATIGVNRLLVWEIPFMGADFALLRFLSTIPLPLFAGFVAIFLVRKFPKLASSRENNA